jgi:hypothetical protein
MLLNLIVLESGAQNFDVLVTMIRQLDIKKMLIKMQKCRKH